MSSDYYATLGVSPDAPPEVIRAAYRVLAQKHHPDRNDQSPEAQEITARINKAYEVLSDPERRAAYDESLRSSTIDEEQPEIRQGPPASPKSVEGEAAGQVFRLRFISGQVIANDLWVDTRVTGRGGLSMGFGGSRTGAEVIPQQRIGVHTYGSDLFVQNTGSHIPVSVGQDVQLVQVFTEDNNREKVIALLNYSTGQWFWIDSQLAAGLFVRSMNEYITDMLLYAAVVGFLAILMWVMFVRGQGVLVTSAFFIFVLPMMMKLAAPLRSYTAFKIARGIGDKIDETVSSGANV